MTAQNTQDKFFYDMQVRKSLIHTAVRDFHYAQHFYSLPVADLTDFGLDIRFAFYQLLQLNLAKLFVDRRQTHRYNLHNLLDQLRTDPFLQGRMPADQTQALADRLAAFRPTIQGLHMVRDQWIAHTDLLGGIAPYHNFFTSTEKLIHFGFEFLDTCSQAILHTPVFNSLHNTTEGDFSLLKKKTPPSEGSPTIA